VRNSGSAALLAECRDTGILASDINPVSWSSAVEVLKTVFNSSPEEQLIRYEQSIDQAELIRLNDIRADIRQQIERNQDELNAMKMLLSDESGFTHEVNEQVSRLKSLNIFAPSEEPHCPVCDQPTPNIPSTTTLTAEIQHASMQLDRVARNMPGLEMLIIEQEQKINDAKVLLQDNRTALEALRRADDRLIQLRDNSSRRAYVIGRVSLFLETLPQVADSSELKAKISELQHEIEKLDSELSDDNIQERLDSILSVISRDLTNWSTQLDLEHSGNPFRFDLRYLKVIADTDRGPIRMDNMGSGANWLGCHLIVHLALHLWFVRKSRPVPRFLFLDQPSQVYFPREQVIDESLANLKDEDRLAVIRMFELIRDVVQSIHPNFQIIITEHADISEDWYQKDGVMETP
jgi:Protein of unknown function (DUF3732)